MKKLKLKLDGFRETLTKEQMKRFIGGDDGPDGPTEGSGSGAGASGSGRTGNGYKCCWTHTTNCSSCVTEAKSNWLCVSGATLTAC